MQHSGSITGAGGDDMPYDQLEETFVEQKVTYTLQVEGRFVIIENVPARVSRQTGERFFSPQTVERLQQIVWEEQTPVRIVQTPIYEYAGIAT